MKGSEVNEYSDKMTSLFEEKHQSFSWDFVETHLMEWLDPITLAKMARVNKPSNKNVNNDNIWEKHVKRFISDNPNPNKTLYKQKISFKEIYKRFYPLMQEVIKAAQNFREYKDIKPCSDLFAKVIFNGFDKFQSLFPEFPFDKIAPNSTQVHGSFLHYAALHNKPYFIKLIIENKCELSSTQRFEKNKTPLMIAAEGNYIECMKILISKSYNIEANDIYGATALSLAFIAGRLEAIQLLLNNNASTHRINSRKLDHLPIRNIKKCYRLLAEQSGKKNEREFLSILCGLN